MENKFKQMIIEYPDSISDKKLFLSYMKDLMPTEKLMTNVLGYLMELGIVIDIQNVDEIDAAFEYRYEQMLIDTYGVSRENAVRAIYIWAEYYGHQILGKDCSLVSEEEKSKLQEAKRGKLYQDLFSYRAGTRGIVTGYNDRTSVTVVVPAIIQKNKMQAIGEAAFEGLPRIEQAVISDGIKEIGSRAFYKCINLKQTILPYGIDKIGQSAFAECDKLVTVNIPESVRYIGDYAFENTNIREIDFPKTVLSVGRGLYKRCRNLSAATLPENTLEIPAEMFMDCLGLTKFKLPAKLQKIGSKAFAGCENIAWIQFPETITEIAEDAFEGMSNGFIMICDADSVAEKYARDHRIRYQLG